MSIISKYDMDNKRPVPEKCRRVHQYQVIAGGPGFADWSGPPATTDTYPTPGYLRRDTISNANLTGIGAI